MKDNLLQQLNANQVIGYINKFKAKPKSLANALDSFYDKKYNQLKYCHLDFIVLLILKIDIIKLFGHKRKIKFYQNFFFIQGKMAWYEDALKLKITSLPLYLSQVMSKLS